MSANMVYGEVKLEPVGAGVYEDPDKIVKSVNTESCQLAERSGAGVAQPAVSDIDTVGENVNLSG